MKKRIVITGSIIGLMFVSHFALAKPDTDLTLAHNAKGDVDVLIPVYAMEVAPNVFDLGVALDPEHGDMVHGYLIAHPYVGAKKPSGTPGGGNGHGGGGGGSTSDSSSCYGFLGNGVKWKGTPEPWVVNTSNPSGISSASVFSLLSQDIGKWEDAADGAVDGNSIDIVGDGSATTSILVADTSSMDDQNEVYFGSLSDNNTIAVTIVWGIFNGPPQAREIREWDQVYNTYYDWSDTGAANAMDFESISTHELGHTMGLDDLYDDLCSEQTMYGYGSEGETKARSLETGDINGISELY